MKPSIGALRKAAGFQSQGALLTAIGFSKKNASFGVRLDQGKIPPNHPVLPTLAKALNRTEDEIRVLCTGKPLSDKLLRQTSTTLQRHLLKRGAHGQSKALVPYQPRGTVRPDQRRNALLRTDHLVRQAARTLAGSASLAAIGGKAYLEVVSTEDLYLVLSDYFRRCGIDIPLMPHPRFAEVFG